MPRSFTFATIAEYKAAKASSGTVGAIYAELVSSGIKSGSCVSKITATGDTFVDSINPFVTPELGQEGDTLYYSSTEGYRFLRSGNTTWDADSYGQVFIDLAKIPSGFSVVAPYTDIFNYKQTDENIGSGKSSMTKILGNTVAWNQLVQDAASAIMALGTRTIKDSRLTIVGTSTSVSVVNLINVASILSHKYYVGYKEKKKNISLYLASDGAYITQNFNTSTIVTANSSNSYIQINGKCDAVGDSVDTDVAIPIHDLTLLYGSAIDGMTDAQILAKFESEFPGYYSYNAGTLISNKAKAIEFVWFNQWDEEWGNYGWSGSTKVSNPNQVASENYIPVLGGRQYCVHYGGGTNNIFYVYQFDENKKYLSQIQTIAKDSIITLADTTRYIQFALTSAYGTTYNNDICINLSGKRNGQYEPYKKVVLPLPNLDQIKVYSHNIWDEEWERGTINTTTLEIAPAANGNCIISKNFCPILPNTSYYTTAPYNFISYGLYRVMYDENKNALYRETYGAEFTTQANVKYFKLAIPVDSYGSTAYQNNICINLSSSFNGQYEPHGILTMEGGLKSAGSVRDEIVGNKYIKRVESVDMGTLNYGYVGDTNKVFSLNSIVSTNLLCSKYVVKDVAGAVDNNAANVMDDKSMTWRHGTIDRLYIRDTAYTGAATFKTAMSGVYLNYGLATPIEYEIYSPTKMPFNWKYRVSEYHTKKMLPENGENPTSAPFACEIKQI